MTSPDRDYIEQRFNHLTSGPQWEQPAPTPYGPPLKAPMTAQTKALLAMVGLAIVGGSAVGVSAYSASSGEADVRAKELALQSQQLEVERAKVNAPDAKAEERRVAGFQACIEKAEHDKEVCAQAFPAPGAEGFGRTLGAANVSSVSDSDQGGKIDVTGGLVIAVVVVGGVAFLVRKAGKVRNAE
ncbi:hypothetical protein PV677_35925 [Streptomyces sp. DE06-01C]|uniref:hypothetical protein n=1 Tax=Streptomyces sp. DE06-01C TaxID=3028656 RepID=UPI0029C1B9B7|nr:hypothetical protein [Streptomyces sp. DE06-01C]MDX5526059.1 hypothetical protein [Streptomyces sp. DE06-01C]